MMEKIDQSMKLSLDPQRRLLTRAEIRMVTGRFEQAQEDLDHLLRESPDFFEGRITRAYLFYLRKEYKLALEDVKVVRSLVEGSRSEISHYFEELFTRIPCKEGSSQVSLFFRTWWYRNIL